MLKNGSTYNWLQVYLGLLFVQSALSGSSQNISEGLEASEAEMYCIVVTDKSDKDSLHNMTSTWSRESRVFVLNNYTPLSWKNDKDTNETETDENPQKVIAEALKDSGAEMHCIIIEEKRQKDLLYKIASNLLQNTQLFVLNNYSSFSWTNDEITNKTGIPHNVSEALEVSEAEMYCIVATEKINKDSLYNMTSTLSQESRVFVLNNYTSLSWMDDEVTNETEIPENVVAEALKDSGKEMHCIILEEKSQKDYLYKIASNLSLKIRIFLLKNYNSLSWTDDKNTNETDYSQCGRGPEKDYTHRKKNVGGKRAVEPWPWMAAIFFLPHGILDPARAKLKCGGSIIHEYFILTAAHCMYTMDKNIRKIAEIIVKVGLMNVTDETYLQEPEVIDFFIHHMYSPGDDYDYDIALLQLSTPIKYNEHVRPICLPPSELQSESKLYKPNEFTLAIGWGHSASTFLGVDIKLSDFLKEVVLPIQPTERCAESLVQYHIKPRTYYTERMFCAGYDIGGNDTCQGDSGGPLMQFQFNEEGHRIWTQVGIVSWGIGCGLPNTYGFYSHVSQLRLWIDETIELFFWI